MRISLARVALGGAPVDIEDLVADLLLLFPVAVAPPAQAQARPVAGPGGDDRHCQQHRLQAGQQKQVHRKGHAVDRQIRQGVPDGLTGVHIAVGGGHGPVRLLEEIRIQQMGVGGAAEFAVDVAAELQAQVDPAEDGVGVQVGPAAVDQDHGQGEGQDQPHQGGGTVPPLHGPQHRRGRQQLQQVGGDPRQDHPRRQGQDQRRLPPGPPRHIAAVLQGVVLRFLSFFFQWDLSFPREHTTRSRSPGGFGDELRPAGDELHYPWGRRISVVKAPSSLLRLR